MKDANNVFNIKSDSSWTGKKSRHYVRKVIGGKTVCDWYLMYYARPIVNGTNPKDIPKVLPQNWVDPVNIDWQRLDIQGKPDLEVSEEGRQGDGPELRGSKGNRQALLIELQWRRGHRHACHARLGCVQDVATANGKKVEISSKQDVLDLAATYNVLIWNYSGPKPKADPDHWSKTGN